jgi:segment polarity protein dishevelled
LVNWLFENVDGFVNRNDARKYASSMLKAGYIRHTVHKLTFSEQCYYVFGDIYSQGMNNVSCFSLKREDDSFIFIDGAYR